MTTDNMTTDNTTASMTFSNAPVTLGSDSNSANDGNSNSLNYLLLKKMTLFTLTPLLPSESEESSVTSTKRFWRRRRTGRPPSAEEQRVCGETDRFLREAGGIWWRLRVLALPGSFQLVCTTAGGTLCPGEGNRPLIHLQVSADNWSSSRISQVPAEPSAMMVNPSVCLWVKFRVGPDKAEGLVVSRHRSGQRWSADTDAEGTCFALGVHLSLWRKQPVCVWCLMRVDGPIVFVMK